MTPSTLRSLALTALRDGSYDLPLGMVAVPAEEVIGVCDALEKAERERDDSEADAIQLRAGIDAIRRAHDPKGACLVECASWSDDDCDCGYIAAGDDVGAFARDLLDVTLPAAPVAKDTTP